jgi:hypothetical protein
VAQHDGALSEQVCELLPYCNMVTAFLYEHKFRRPKKSPALRVQINYDAVDLRTTLVQLFVLLQLNFEEVV